MGSCEAAGVMAARVSAGEYIDFLSARFTSHNTDLVRTYTHWKPCVYCVDARLESISSEAKTSLSDGTE